MKNPFSYRNTLARELRQKRREIQQWYSKQTADELYKELQDKKKDPKFIKHELIHNEERKAKIYKAWRKNRDLEWKMIVQYQRETSHGRTSSISLLTGRIIEEIFPSRMKEIDLDLPHLKKITPEAAQMLSKYKGLWNISWAAFQGNILALKALKSHKSHITFTNVGNLSHAEVKAFLHFEEQEDASQNGWVSFKNISNLTPEAAEILAQYQWKLSLEIKNLTPQCAEILAKKQGKELLMSPDISEILVKRFRIDLYNE